MYVWLEGADDLTQEAQAFLRRILETASPNITCVLEVREPWKLSPTILSRCTVVNMKSKESFRKVKNTELAKRLCLLKPQAATALAAQDIPRLRREGVDPFSVFEAYTNAEGWTNPLLQRCLAAVGSGSSPWAQLAVFLHAREKES